MVSGSRQADGSGGGMLGELDTLPLLAFPLLRQHEGQKAEVCLSPLPRQCGGASCLEQMSPILPRTPQLSFGQV